MLYEVITNPLALFSKAADTYGAGVLAPGKLVSSPLEAVSLGLALMFGTAGLPHILMRFYTVPDAKAARASVFYATGCIGFFYLVVITSYSIHYTKLYDPSRPSRPSRGASRVCPKTG